MVDITRYNRISLDVNSKMHFGIESIPRYLVRPYLRINEVLKKFLIDNPSRKTLCDLGCGVGLHSFRYAKMGYDVVGVDLSEHSLSYAKDIQLNLKQKSVIRFVHADIIEYLQGLPDNCLDVVTMHGVLYYLDKIIVVKEINRVLRPDGLLCFVETNGSNFILNAYRRIRHFFTQYRDQQTINNLIDRKSFLNIASQFPKYSLYYDDCMVLLARLKMFRGDRIYNFLSSIDACILNKFNVFSFKVSLIAKK